MSFRATILRGCIAVAIGSASLFSTSAYAFADDQARRAILDLREQLNTLVDQSRKIRVQQADQIEALQQEVARLRGEVEHLSHMAKQQAQQQSARNTTSVQVADAIEQAAFDHAMQSFRAGQYQSAATE